MNRLLTLLTVIPLLVGACGPATPAASPKAGEPIADSSSLYDFSQSIESTRPTATVLAEGLNVRAGPDTVYDVVEVALRDAPLAILGQAYDCGWLQVTTQSGVTGWVSAPFVSFNLSCDQIDAAGIPPTPTQQPRPAGFINPTDGSEYRLIQPLEKNLGGRQRFIWDSIELAAGEAYELLFWKIDQQPLERGFSPVAYVTFNQVVFNLDDASNRLPQLQVGQDYFWSVAVVDEATEQRLRLLHPGHRFHLSFYGASERSGQAARPTNTPRPTSVPESAQPTVIANTTSEPTNNIAADPNDEPPDAAGSVDVPPPAITVVPPIPGE